MKTIISLSILFLSASSLALTLDDVALNTDLRIQNSNGPKYKEALQEHALFEWEGIEDLNNLIGDGLIHSVYEGACDPEAYSIDNIEVTNDWPNLRTIFKSIKKGSRSIAYIAHPVVTYTTLYSVYKTHADYKSNRLTEITIECDIQSDIGFYYEHNKEQSVIYLGYIYSLEDYRKEFLSEPNAGILFNDQLVEDKANATNLFNAIKASQYTQEEINACYFGEWEQAVNSIYPSISIGVIEVSPSKDLQIEINNLNNKEIVLGSIKTCE